MRIVILRTNELPTHTLICISDSSDSTIQKKMKKKYGVEHLEVLFSADAVYEYRFFDYDDLTLRHLEPHDSIRYLPSELRRVLESSISPIGEDVFRSDTAQVVALAAKFFQQNVTCASSIRALVEGTIATTRGKEDQHRLKQKNEQDYFKTFESQCLQLNLIWESHWNRWVSDFRRYIRENPFPKKDDGFWGREKKQQDFNRQALQYMSSLFNLTREWRVESRRLPTTFHANCRKCNGTGEVIVSATGPGNKRTLGHINSNTIAQEYGKPFAIECGRKLKNGRQYFFRHILNFSGTCKSCETNLFQPSSFGGGTNWAKFSWDDTWCVYPFRDVESWWEWCGVWMTIFDWEAHSGMPLEARDFSDHFFKDFESVVDLHWHLQYPRPQLPETYMSP